MDRYQIATGKKRTASVIFSEQPKNTEIDDYLSLAENWKKLADESNDVHYKKVLYKCSLALLQLHSKKIGSNYGWMLNRD